MEWLSIAEKLWKDVKHNDSRYRAGLVSLPFKRRLYFSIGHVFSDLCYLIWSTYLLIYFNKVVGLSPSIVGYVFMIAQCSDALLTPFIEVGMERVLPKKFPRYGRRKLWHLFGTVLVFLAWPLVFSSCLVCSDNSSPSAKLGYYSIVVMLLHVGWAIVRISHLSLMPEIAQRQDEEAELSAIRSWLSFVFGMIIFSITWILLGQADGQKVTPDLKHSFTSLSLTVVGFGLVFSFLFHWGTVEPEANSYQAQRRSFADIKAVNRRASSRDLYVLRRHTESTMSLSQQPQQGSCIQNEEGGDQDEDPPRSWQQWCNDYDLYKVAVVYVCSRVVCTILQLYIVFYVTDSLEFSKEAIAFFPLALLITEVVSSTLATSIRKTIGNKWTFCAAAVGVFLSCVWFQLQTETGQNFVFLSSILFGASSSIMMGTSLSMLADLAKKDKRSSGFIYSTMGFFDKVSVGLFILIIQRNYPDGIGCPTCGNYARLVITLIPSVFTTIALVLVVFAFRTNLFLTCKNSANQTDQWTQTDIDAPPKAPAQANGSIYAINEENDVTKNNDDIHNSRVEYDHKDAPSQEGKGTLCRSTPVLSMRRSFSFPATSPKSSAQRSSIAECRTLEGVALAVEKVVVFSFDSLPAGEVLSVSERSLSLPPVSVEEDKGKTNGKSSENVYQKISLLQSTDL